MHCRVAQNLFRNEVSFRCVGYQQAQHTDSHRSSFPCQAVRSCMGKSQTPWWPRRTNPRFEIPQTGKAETAKSSASDVVLRQRDELLAQRSCETNDPNCAAAELKLFGWSSTSSQQVSKRSRCSRCRGTHCIESPVVCTAGTIRINM